MYSRPRFNRGTSVIAALVFAALLGAVALGLHALQPNAANTVALSASVDASSPGVQSASANPQAAQPQTISDNQSCATVVATANTNQQATPPSTIVDKSADVTDSCNAAAVDTTQSTASKQVFKCVGKSGEMIDDGNGTYTEDLHTDAIVPAGKCSVQVCTIAGKCNATQQLNGISSASIASALTSSQIANVTPDQGLTFPDQTTPTPACQGEVCAPLASGQDPRLDLAQGQTPAPAPGGSNIDCDANPSDCSQTQTPQEQASDPNTYCYDNGKTCYPPDSQIAAYTDLGWTCTGDKTGTTACTSSPTATQPCQGSNCSGNQQGSGAGTGVGAGAGPGTGGSGLKAPTFTNPQAQGGAQQNNCNIISSILGGCTANNGLSCQLTVSPNPPQQGMPANISWTTTGTVYGGSISGVGNITGPNGSLTVYPNGSTNYTMTVYNQQNQQASCNVAVNVTPRAGTGTGSGVTPQTPYGVGTNGQACSAPPPQPDPTQCTSGSWQPVSAAGNGCITSYQCGGQTAGAPTAQLSCSPQVADVGMSVAISYSCANAIGSSGSGFTTGNQTSGSTTTVITAPPSGTNTANFGLTCTNGAQASGAQCSVQINQAAIVLVANPKAVPSGQTSSIGWVTAGMQACVISSPDDYSFTTANASNQSINGVAQSDAITGDTEFDLTCTTLGGLTKFASTTVSVAAATSTTP